MKRRDLIKHLEANGCELLRENGNHTIYLNRQVKKVSAIPRHREVNEFIHASLKNKLTYKTL